MDCSDRKSVSSSSSSTHVIKPSSTSKPSASDENYQSYPENGANPPPPTPPTKHFMSPTISAASKAVAPRKKILAERNEISDTRIQKTLNIGSKGTFSNPDINNSDDSLSVNVDSSPLPRPKFLRYGPKLKSPTISAASKAIAPRKKILAERNEISDTHIQKTLNIGSKGTFSNPDINNSDDSLSVNVDSSPLPRPKFLSYKPNRGRDIILRHENEVKGEKERSTTDKVTECEEVDEREVGVQEEEEEGEEREGFCRRGEKTLNIGSKGTFSNPDINNSDDYLSVNVDSSPLPILRHENEVKGEKERSTTDEVTESEEVDEREEGVQVEEEEEEEEEEGEEREGFCRRVLKFLLVLVVLVFSTMYISSWNSPTYSQSTLQAMEGLRDGYLKIHDRVLNSMNFKEIVMLLEGGNEYLDGNIIGLMKINQTVIYKGVEQEEEIVGEVYIGKVEEISEFEVEEEKDNGEEEMVEEVNMGEEEKGNGEEEMVEEVYMGESVEILAGESEEVCDLETAKTGEAVDHMLENFELEGTESVEKLELLLPIVTNVALQQEDEVAMEAVQENNMGADEGLEMVESEMEKTENSTDKAGEVFMLEGMDNEITNFEILNLEGEDDLKEERFIEHIESEIILKAVIGVTLCFAIVASLVLAFRLMRKRNKKKKDYSSLVMRHCSNESGVEEKRSSISPNEREEHDKQQRVDDSFASPMSLINSTPLKGAEESSQMRAPSIELLGEFVVGELSSCSFRSRRIIESEVSSHSVPSDNKGLLRSKTTYSVPTHAQELDFSEASSAIHPQSYGYFTPEKEVVSKKEEGGTGIDGEAKKLVVTTPLRRSSRLRNRVTSP